MADSNRINLSEFPDGSPSYVAGATINRMRAVGIPDEEIYPLVQSAFEDVRDTGITDPRILGFNDNVMICIESMLGIPVGERNSENRLRPIIGKRGPESEL